MNTATLPKKGLKTRRYSMDMNKDDHIATLPKKGLKTRPYNIGMEKKGLKKYDYNIDMEKKDLKKLTKQWRGGSEAAGEAARLMAPPPPSHTFFASWSGTRPRDACHVIGTTCNDRRSLRNTFGWIGVLGRI